MVLSPYSVCYSNSVRRTEFVGKGVSIENRAPTSRGAMSEHSMRNGVMNVFAKNDDTVGFQARCANAPKKGRG
jgi:hypothetical protein